MEQADIDKLGEEVRILDPNNDAHWNAGGYPNCNYLRERVGFNVTSSTLVTHGLNVTREQAGLKVLADAQPGFTVSGFLKGLLAKVSPEPPPAAPEIKDPGAPPVVAGETLLAAGRPAPFEAETWDAGTTLHRNKKALQMLHDSIRAQLDVLSRMSKKSSRAAEFERHAQGLLPELEAALAKL